VNELKIRLKLRYFPVNAAWSFVFGDAPITLAGFPQFFSDRAEAVRAAFPCRPKGLALLPEVLLEFTHPIKGTKS
jgi:hypothetical protein